jgi:hypothetical protein
MHANRPSRWSAAAPFAGGPSILLLPLLLIFNPTTTPTEAAPTSCTAAAENSEHSAASIFCASVHVNTCPTQPLKSDDGVAPHADPIIPTGAAAGGMPRLFLYRLQSQPCCPELEDSSTQPGSTQRGCLWPTQPWRPLCLGTSHSTQRFAEMMYAMHG